VVVFASGFERFVSMGGEEEGALKRGCVLVRKREKEIRGGKAGFI
jgi:hypothetical protein